MIKMVTKRDGRVVPFNENKIMVAIGLSLKNTDLSELDIETAIHEIYYEVITVLSNVSDVSDTINVEDIQDIIIASMKNLGYDKSAKSFTAYRNKRTKVRERKTSLMKQISEMANASAAESDGKRENANIDGDTAMGTMLKFGTTTSKEYYLREVIPEDASNLHRTGYIHIHDMDFYSLTTTCLTPDTKILLKVNDSYIYTTFAYFDDYFNTTEDSLEYLNNIEIFNNGSFTPVKWVSRRHIKENEIVYKVSNKFDTITMTESHQVPVIRNNEQVLINAKDIRIGDRMIYTAKMPSLINEINCIDLFKDIDLIVIKNTTLLRKLAHDHKFIEKFYKCLGCPNTSTKYIKPISLREYLRVRHLFVDILDEHDLKLDVRQGHSSGYPAYIKLDSNLGKFIGYVYSEGCCCTVSKQQGVTFTNRNISMLDEFAHLSEVLFNIIPQKYQKDSCWDLQIGKAYIAQLFNGPFGIKENSYNIVIPNWMYFANYDFLDGFISGLIDGDGSVSSQFDNIRYGTSCKHFAKHLHELLYLHGINSVMSEKLCEGEEKWFGNVLSISKSNHYILDICGYYIDELNLTKSILYNNNKKDVKRVPQRTLQNLCVNNISSVDYDGFVYDIETGSHYFTANSFVVHNCLQLPLAKLLKNGFSTGHGHLRTPNGINTAAALTCIVIQSNQNDQHGGQSIPKFDYDLAPYVAKSFITNICEYLDDNEISESTIKNIKEQLEILREKSSSLMSENTLDIIKDIIEENILNNSTLASSCIKKAIKRTNRDTYQAMEALIHNLNTMNSRAGAQVPFSSINLGTDTSPEGRMIIKNFLLAQDAGLGDGETPIFPISIFKTVEGINYNPEDPNYDLFKLACKVSAKRLFPNFSFPLSPFNAPFYKKDNPDTEIAYMGCVKSNERVHIQYNGKNLHIDFNQFYNIVQQDFSANKYSGKSEYYVTDSKIRIYDSSVGHYVNCKKFIINHDVTNWLEIKFSNGFKLVCTTDHPLPIYNLNGNSVRTYAKDIKENDLVALSNLVNGNSKYINVISITPINCCENSFDVETETDRFDVSGICSHNCRTRVISDITDPDNQIVTGRGNLSFTSINLPRLAIEAKGNIKEFYKSLDNIMEVVKNQLLHRYKIQCNKTIKNYPFLMGQGAWMHSDELGMDDNLEPALKHGTLSIGFIGLAETLKALIGKHHGESEAAQKLGLEIIGHMRDYTDRVSKQYNLNFSLLATPAEGLSGRFVKMDKKRFGIIEGVTDRDYYTNSTHVPVYYPISAYKKIQIEAPYQALCNAGHICYVELDGDPTENMDAFESVIRCMHDEGIGYGAVNHPVDRDPICGYVGIIGDTCPCCGRHEGEALTPEVYRNIIAKNRLGGIYGK